MKSPQQSLLCGPFIHEVFWQATDVAQTQMIGKTSNDFMQIPIMDEKQIYLHSEGQELGPMEFDHEKRRSSSPRNRLK